MKTPSAKRLITYKERSYNSYRSVDGEVINDSYLFLRSRKKTKAKHTKYRYRVDSIVWDRHNKKYVEKKDEVLSLGTIKSRMGGSDSVSITQIKDYDYEVLLAKLTLIS